MPDDFRARAKNVRHLFWIVAAIVVAVVVLTKLITDPTLITYGLVVAFGAALAAMYRYKTKGNLIDAAAGLAVTFTGFVLNAWHVRGWTPVLFYTAVLVAALVRSRLKKKTPPVDPAT